MNLFVKLSFGARKSVVYRHADADIGRALAIEAEF